MKNVFISDLRAYVIFARPTRTHPLLCLRLCGLLQKLINTLDVERLVNLLEHLIPALQSVVHALLDLAELDVRHEVLERPQLSVRLFQQAALVLAAAERREGAWFVAAGKQLPRRRLFPLLDRRQPALVLLDLVALHFEVQDRSVVRGDFQ